MADNNVYLDFKTMGEEGNRIFLNFVTFSTTTYGWDNTNHKNIKKWIAEEYNGAYMSHLSKSYETQKHYIRFSDPKDLTAFLLRFG